MKRYYASGQLETETPYENDKINGVRKEYYESGKLKEERLYKNGKLFIYKEYNEQGKLIISTE